MLNYFSKNFLRGPHYLVEVRDQNEIDRFLIEHLFNPSQVGHRRDPSVDIAQQIPLIGRKLGWVPNHFPFTFFSETVEQEIANAFVSKQNKLIGRDREIEKVRFLLEKLEIAYLAKHNPFFLSEGETKLVWFLCQWAKLPDYLIISYLPGSLSQQKIDQLLKFLLNSEQIAELSTLKSPTFILGYLSRDEQWCETLTLKKNWKKIYGFRFNR